MRNQFSMDLLRKDISVDDLIYTLEHKRELTDEDRNKIIDSAEKIIQAVRTVQQ